MLKVFFHFITSLILTGFISSPAGAKEVEKVELTPPALKNPLKWGTIEQISNVELPRILIEWASVIFLIMFFVGGVMYLTSAGNEEAANKAKKTLLYAVIGLLIVLMAYAIVNVFELGILKSSK